MIDTPELALAETFYASGLPSPQQAEFAQALRIAGLDGEIALMRFHIRDLIHPEKDEYKYFQQAMKLLNSLVKTNFRFSPSNDGAISLSRITPPISTITGSHPLPHRDSPPPAPVPAVASQLPAVNHQPPAAPVDNPPVNPRSPAAADKPPSPPPTPLHPYARKASTAVPFFRRKKHKKH